MKIIEVKTAKDLKSAQLALDQCKLRMSRAKAPSKSREDIIPNEPVIIIFD